MSLEKIYKLVVETFFLVLFGLALGISCANPLAPTGGPKDTLPPQVMGYLPKFGETNFKAKRIQIDFDEYMVLKEQQKEFYVSPFTSIKPTVSMRGKSIYIEFLDTLLENQTYAVNFGSSITDNNEGNKLYNFRYVFSTGDEIDSMLMSGYTADAYTGDSIASTFILFYDLALDTIPDYDSLLLLTKPSVVARSQSYGGFIAENLKPIDYKVYAFDDTNYNQTYDPGVDRVAFLDSVYNPLTSPSFDIWFDENRGYMVSDPQMYFRLFTENTFKRQYLNEVTRVNKQLIVIDFAQDDPVIESLSFDSLEMSDFIFDYLKPEKDSIALWINLPPELVPDTIRGEIISLKHDTANVLRPDTQKLELIYTYFETRSKKELKEIEEDSTLLPNPFKIKVDAGNAVNPNKHIPIRFDYPLIHLDTAQILLLREAEDDKLFKVRFKMENDTIDQRKWTLKANWQAGSSYKLEIPAETFINVARESNDTLKANFTIDSPDKYAKLVLNVKGETPESIYVMQLLDSKNKVVEEIINVKDGTYTIDYIKAATYRLRFIQDVNANGIWDTGELVSHTQSERVEMFYNAEGDIDIEAKANWELEFDIDLKPMFYEMTHDNILEYLAKKQRAVERKIQREILKNKPVYQSLDEDLDHPGHSHEGHDHEHE